MSLDGFVQLIFNVYEAHTVALFVGDGASLSCFSAITFSKHFDKTRALPVDGTLPGWAVKHRQPLIIGNFDKDEETLGYYTQKEEIKSFMAHPLDTPGVIVVDSKKKWVFTDKEKKILAHFVTVLTAEVEREKRLQQMEEEHEELLATRRSIALLRDPRSGDSAVDGILKEGLAVSGADMAITGVERNGRLKVIASTGTGSADLVGADCPAGATIASTVIESGREFVLPYESGYLREKPLLFPNDGVRARQYFGFPLMLEEKPYGFVGFVSVSSKRLKEAGIGALRDMSVLLSLHLSRVKIQQEIAMNTSRDQVTGALRIGSFLNSIKEMAKKKREFSLVSIKLGNFDACVRSMGMEYTDALLRRMYQTIEYCVGKHAVVARIRGAHFLVLLKASEVMEGRNILKILRLTILSDLSKEEALPKHSIQVGTAHFPRDGEAPWELIDRAEDRGGENTA